MVPEPSVFITCFFLFFPVLLALPSLFSYPYSYLLHFPTFSCATIHALPPNYSFYPFSSTLSPSSPPCPILPNLSSHYLSLLHTQHALTSLLYQLYTTPAPVILDTSTIHDNRNTPKHTEGPQKPAAPISLPHPSPFPSPLFSAIFTNSLKPITSLVKITPTTPTLYGYYHQKVLYIIFNQLV
jgi:hypothetical protein